MRAACCGLKQNVAGHDEARVPQGLEKKRLQVSLLEPVVRRRANLEVDAAADAEHARRDETRRLREAGTERLPLLNDVIVLMLNTLNASNIA
jgi:hypothetical protein